MNNKTKMIVVKNYLDVLKMNNNLFKFGLVQDDLDLYVDWEINEDLTLKQAKQLNDKFFEFLREIEVEFDIYHEDCGIDTFQMVLRGICDY